MSIKTLKTSKFYFNIEKKHRNINRIRKHNFENDESFHNIKCNNKIINYIPRCQIIETKEKN